jgi:hypothetical protein
MIANYNGNNPYVDASGNNKNLTTTTSGVVLSENQRGESQGALRFLNNYDYASSAINLGLSGNTTYAYSFWIKFNDNIDGSNRNVLSFGVNYDSRNGSAASFVINNTGLASWGGYADAGVEVSGLNWQNWHHFAFSYDGSLETSMFYLDKENLPDIWIGAFNTTNIYNLVDSPLTLGYIPGAFEGIGGASISDVRIYNRTLSSSEVQQIYTQEVPEPSSLSLLVLGGVVVALRQRKKY